MATPTGIVAHGWQLDWPCSPGSLIYRPKCAFVCVLNEAALAGVPGRAGSVLRRRCFRNLPVQSSGAAPSGEAPTSIDVYEKRVAALASYVTTLPDRDAGPGAGGGRRLQLEAQPAETVAALQARVEAARGLRPGERRSSALNSVSRAARQRGRRRSSFRRLNASVRRPLPALPGGP